MRRVRSAPRSGPNQGVFPFVRRSERRARAFRLGLVGATGVAIVALVAASPVARRAVLGTAERARWWGLRRIGIEPSRAEFEAERDRGRRLGVERTRAALARTVADSPPALGRFLDAASMGADSALIRPGNYDQALVLSSRVFEADDAGRSYRLRPETRSIWVIGISLNRVSTLFEIPDTAAARAAAAEAGGRVVPESVQTTGAWGCRGPGPDPDAPLRGIVLGDSVIQGVLVGDDQTPVAALEREVAARAGVRASVLNAGVLGYSPEQYYHTLVAFSDRFRPHFVVVGICGNDFGPWDEPEGWDEGRYWFEQIAQHCRTRGLPYLFVSWPGEDSLMGARDDGTYPGKVSHVLRLGGAHYLYPIEEFTREELRLRIASRTDGRSESTSPLYNRHLLGDNHMSPLGCALWGRVVADRIAAILAWERVRRLDDDAAAKPTGG